jgi:L-alanine-DL-glutamate epimerase-like enolase superfamily enzyme
VIGAIRDEVGTDCDIIIGTHGQITAAGALRIAQRLERFDPLWYEEPCPLIAAAALQLSLCSPNLLIMEAIERFDGIGGEFVESSFQWRDGYLLPPRGPGLGFNLREDVARSHAPLGPQPGTIRSY